jgi:hypothetical protein
MELQMIKAIQFISILFLFSSPVVQAGTIIEIKSGNEMTTVLTDGKQARMNMAGPEYVLIDYKNQDIKVVSKQKQEVMLLDTDGMPTGNTAPAVRTSINKLGTGQVIAGYKTQKFSYTANGVSCGVIHGSKAAHQVNGVKELFIAMKAMMEKEMAVMGGYAGMADACTLADMQVSDHVNTIGVPMRTEKNGIIDSEIISIKTDMALPADTFIVPASYKTVSMQDKMKSMSKDMQKMQQSQPQMQPQYNEAMRQMQQSGQLTPEMMEQMRRSQQMMQQYQQR